MPSEKKVLHFDTGRNWRGGQNQVYLLIKSLKEHGVKQNLISPAGSPLFEKVKKIGVPVFSLDPKNDIDIISAFKLKKLATEISPDVIHLHSGKSLAIAALSISKSEAKKIFTRRVDFPLKNNFFTRYKYNFPDRIVAISDFIKDQLLEKGYKKTVKIYSAVDTEKYRVSRDYSLKEGPLKIGMVGALDLAHKDYITFIEVAEKAVRDRSVIKTKFYIAGDGKDRKKIEKLILDKDLQKTIELKGFMENITEFYKDIDILLHTVAFEGLGTSVLQGMAAGLPVIATAVGGLKEIIKEGKTGFLTDKSDSEGVFLKLKELIKEPTLRKVIGEHAENAVKERFSIQKMAEEYLTLYGIGRG